MNDPTLQIHEIYASIQGESSHAGFPCVFIRLAGCSLGCSWCDTRASRGQGRPMTLSRILRKASSYRIPWVEVTGGEPLEQAAVSLLLKALLKRGYRVLLETNGAQDISRVPRAVIKIMDIKCPSSGCEEWNLWSNLRHLTREDEIKFVIRDRRDYRYAKSVIRHRGLSGHPLLFSAVHRELDPGVLAEWVLKDRLPVRVQIQLHKYLWRDHTRGR